MNEPKQSEAYQTECSRLFCADRRTEALFCLALLPEGTDVVERVTTRFLAYRDKMTPELLALIDGKQNGKAGGDGVSSANEGY